MSDQRYLLLANQAVPPQTPIMLRLVDNGDGTYSLATTGASATGAALTSSARAATTNSADITNPGGDTLQVAVAATAFSLAFSIVPSIQAKDPTTGQYRTLLTGTTMTATGVTWMAVGPQLTASANNFAKDIVPSVFRVSVAHTGTNPVTYAVGWSVS